MATFTLRVNDRSTTVDVEPEARLCAAIANALALATGRRLRALPFTPERVKQVLA